MPELDALGLAQLQLLQDRVARLPLRSRLILQWVQRVTSTSTPMTQYRRGVCVHMCIPAGGAPRPRARRRAGRSQARQGCRRPGTRGSGSAASWFGC
jgi:hypothetical protein